MKRKKKKKKKKKIKKKKKKKTAPTLTRLSTAVLTAVTGRDKSGIAFPSSASS